jgi:hypothetical protein
VKPAALLMLVIVVAGCRAPGEPPSHPDIEEYRDLVRRELTTLQTAQASTRLLLRYAARGDVPDNYGIVVLRQNATDLHGVVTDLREVEPPPGLEAAHRHLQRIARRDARLVDRLAHAWDHHDLRLRVRKTLGDDADTVGSTLDKELAG